MRTWKVLILLVAMITVLSACGGTGGSSSGSSTGSSSSNGSTKQGSSGKTVTITEEDYFSGKAAKTLEKWETKFEKTHQNIKIQRHQIPYTQLLPKSLKQAKTNSLTTILICDNLNTPVMVKAGALEPISKFGSFDKSNYLKGPMQTVTVNGKIYGIPFGSNDLALFYNKTLLKKAGINPPKTWAELVTDAKKLHHGSTYGVVFSAPSNEQATWQFSPFMWMSGGSFTKFGSPQTIKALKLWNKLVQEGGTSKSVVNFSQNQVYNEFAAGRAAMMVMGPWKLPNLAGTNIKYGVVPLPTPKKGQKAISPIGGEDLTITTSATSQQQKAAWKFINWLQDKTRLPQIDKSFGYVPAYKPAYKKFASQNPKFKVFANELKNARALTASSGARFPAVSQAVATSIQKMLTGGESAKQAAKEAQSQIDQVLGK